MALADKIIKTAGAGGDAQVAPYPPSPPCLPPTSAYLAHTSWRRDLAHISPIPPQADLKKFIADAKITDQYSGELNIWNPTQARARVAVRVRVRVRLNVWNPTQVTVRVRVSRP